MEQLPYSTLVPGEVAQYAPEAYKVSDYSSGRCYYFHNDNFLDFAGELLLHTTRDRSRAFGPTSPFKILIRDCRYGSPF